MSYQKDIIHINELVVVEGTDIYSIDCNELTEYIRDKIVGLWTTHQVLIYKKNSEVAEHIKLLPRKYISGVEPELQYTFKLEKKYCCYIDNPTLILQII